MKTAHLKEKLIALALVLVTVSFIFSGIPIATSSPAPLGGVEKQSGVAWGYHLPIILGAAGDNSTTLIHHAPIYIIGNSGFTSANGVNGGGSGTVGDPYIIENWTIGALGAHGISIQNTTAYFIVRNCLVERGGDSYSGIYLNNVINGKIENNTCSGNDTGIYLRYSSYNTLTNNTCSGNLWNGIWLWVSSHNNLTNNTCSNNSNFGTLLFFSSYDTLTNNTFSNNRRDFDVWGADIEDFDHDIDTSNLVNGKPICYLKYSSNLVIDNSWYMGYLGLVGCSNIRVENLVLENNGAGILLAGTKDSLIENCVFSNNDDGICLVTSSYNTLTNNNTCSNNGSGICLRGSSYNNLTNNTCSNNGNMGIILLESSSYNNLTNNTCSNNSWYGIVLSQSSSYDNLTLNTCSNNGGYGIYLESPSSSNTIFLNYLLNNTWNNAYDNGTNYWDKNGEGNYWSDWQPPEHPDADNNGIVDQPRSITGGSNVDNYPLVIPIGTATSLVVTPSTFTLQPGGSTTLTATLTSNDSPLAGKAITWSATGSTDSGSFNPSAGTTDNLGRVAVTYTAPTVSVNLALTIMASFAGDSQYQSSMGLSRCDVYQGTTATLTTHAPITIIGDSDFASANGVTGGSGTQGDPYIIGGWVIDASGSTGITIQNTTRYFVVRNCLIENGGSSYFGILLYNVINGKIENNTCSGNSSGIHLESSHSNELTGNTCENNGYGGIWLYSSNFNTLTGNVCNSNNYTGISLSYSSNHNILTSNTCSGNAGYGILLSDSSNNAIFLNYLLNNGNNAYDDDINMWDNNGKGNYWSNWQPPVHPDNDGNGVVDEPRPISGGTSQDHYPLVRYPLVLFPALRAPISIIGNSSFTPANGVNGGGSGTADDPYIIENWVIDASSADGIRIQDTTKYFIIRNCLVENGGVGTYHGIYLSNVINGKIENNTCRNNTTGIQLNYSSNNTISNNTCRNNNWGIYLYSSSNNNLTNNLLDDTGGGIGGGIGCWIDLSDNNNLTGNKIKGWYSGDGIFLSSSSGNNLTNNTCSNNGYGIHIGYSSNNNTITLNYLLNSTENNAFDDGTDNWDNNGKGNWWSDWQPPQHPDADNDGIVDQQRSIDGGSNVDHYPLVIPIGTATSLVITPSTFTLQPGGSTTLTATLTSNGNPIAGKTITWSATGSTDSGSFSPSAGTTDNLGHVTVTYTAPTVRVNLALTIMAYFAGDSQYQSSTGLSRCDVYITPPENAGTATSLMITPSTFTLQSGGSTTLTATLTSNDAPLIGKTLTWTTTSGGVVPSSGATDSLGQVSVTYAAPSYEDNVVVTATFAGDNEYKSSICSSSGVIEATLLQAIVDLKPDTLHIGSGGRWVTCYIEIPDGNVRQIDVSSILLDGTIPVDLSAFTEIGDYDNDGVPDLMVKFDRSSVENIVSPGPTTLTVTGRAGGLSFIGSDTIDVIQTPQLPGGLVSVVIGPSDTEPTVRQDVFSFTLNLSAEVNNGVVRVTVSSENSEGQVIIVDIDDNVIKFESLDEITVLFDGRKIDMADSYEDVLNLTNENEAEYVVVLGRNGVQLLISVPHFSVHVIDIGRAASFVTTSQPQTVTTTPQSPTVTSTSQPPTEGMQLAAILAVVGVALVAAVSAVWVGLRRSRGKATSELIEHGLSNMRIQEIDIFREIRAQKEFTIPDIINKTGASTIVAWRTVQKLIAKGLVKPTGETRPTAAGRGKPSIVYRYVGD
jgi:parallel beta-helix repeat protein